MPGVGDVDDDGKNEIVCGSAWKVFVLNWNKNTKKFEETVIKTTTGDNYPFACVIKDSDGDGKNEIHVGYSSPMISIFVWNGTSYEIKFEKKWPGEGEVIEGVDVGDVDDDGTPEVCVGTDVVHILQWDGNTFAEEAVLPTFGVLAVVAIGDCDNDGKNEINAGSVMIDHNQDYMYWVYKYSLEPQKNDEEKRGSGSLKVTVEGGALGKTLKDASVAAWNLETKTWYDVQPDNLQKTPYTRDDLPEGEYLLRALMEGYQIKEDTITINAGQETNYTFSLKPTSESRSIAFNYQSNNFIKQILMNIFDNFPVLTKFLQLQI
jgi:WD40 repeat protein